MSVWERHIDDDFGAALSLPLPEQLEVDLRDRPRAPVEHDERGRAIPLRHRLVTLDVSILAVVWGAILLLPAGRAAVDVTAALVAVASGFLSARARGLYTTWVNTMRVVVLSRLMWTAAVSGFAAWVAFLWLDRPNVEGWRTAGGAITSLVLLAVGRALFDRWLELHRAAGRYCRSVVLVGTDADVDEVSRLLADHPELGYQIVGWVGPSGDAPSAGRLGDVEGALSHIEAAGASGALILAAGLDRNEVNDVTRELVDAGIHVHIWSGLAGINYRRLVTVPLGHEPFVHVAPVTTTRPELVAKRAVDIGLAVLVLIVSAPILAVSALLIKRHDGGPVLFRQTRIGQHGQPITIHKLRTMVVDAEARLEVVRAANERTGPLFKMKRDPRVTPIGDLLRRTSIDELPQLLDVLRGDLSLVGPRPALPAEVAQFDDQLMGRLKVRPGITGLWQVEGRDKPSFDVYRRLDLFYVENWSLALDVAILLDSVPAVLARSLKADPEDGGADVGDE